jgi:hypothetical protein
MKQKATNHEVLLFTGTHFSNKQFCDKDRQPPDNSLKDQLQRACWNGFIFEILPGVREYPSQKNISFIWEVIPAENFIDVPGKQIRLIAGILFFTIVLLFALKANAPNTTVALPNY